MGRPKKQTVDYFPHVCRHGKTMFILEQKYGNDGFAFWFKLLELLGDTEGHSIDCNNPATWEFLQSKTNLSEDTCLNILNLLSRLSAIDFDLWQNRIIWSENFIKGIADVYRNRRVEIPSRPDNYTQKTHPDDISTEEKRQSKVKESKVKERKAQDAMPVFSCTYFEVDQKYLDKLLLTYSALSQERLVKEFDRMNDWLEDNKDKRSRKSNGQIKNPRLFIRNWLDRVIVQPDKETPGEPKGFAGIREWYHGKENESGS